MDFLDKHKHTWFATWFFTAMAATVKEYKVEQQMIIQKVSKSDGTESPLPAL